MFAFDSIYPKMRKIGDWFTNYASTCFSNDLSLKLENIISMSYDISNLDFLSLSYLWVQGGHYSVPSML